MDSPKGEGKLQKQMNSTLFRFMVLLTIERLTGLEIQRKGTRRFPKDTRWHFVSLLCIVVKVVMRGISTSSFISNSDFCIQHQ